MKITLDTFEQSIEDKAEQFIPQSSLIGRQKPKG